MPIYPYGRGHNESDCRANGKIKKKVLNTGFQNTAQTLLPKDTSCPECQNKEFEKGTDILDVWFDSGICHYVFKKKYGINTFPADIYLGRKRSTQRLVSNQS